MPDNHHYFTSMQISQYQHIFSTVKNEQANKWDATEITDFSAIHRSEEIMHSVDSKAFRITSSFGRKLFSSSRIVRPVLTREFAISWYLLNNLGEPIRPRRWTFGVGS